MLPSLSQQVHKSFKDAVYQVVWNNLGDCRNDWFPPLEGAQCQTLLSEFKVKSEEFEIEDRFTFKYDDGVCITRLDQATAFSTFYTNKTIYQMAGKECCIAIDVALAMSDSEAVVESYYSVMKTQSMLGGHPRAKNECGLEFFNALAVPGKNQRCGNPLFRRRQRCWTAPPSASTEYS